MKIFLKGEFRGEKKHGFGSYTLPSGNKYTGMYQVHGWLEDVATVLNQFYVRMILRMEMEPSSGRMATSSPELG